MPSRGVIQLLKLIARICRTIEDYVLLSADAIMPILILARSGHRKVYAETCDYVSDKCRHSSRPTCPRFAYTSELASLSSLNRSVNSHFPAPFAAPRLIHDGTKSTISQTANRRIKLTNLFSFSSCFYKTQFLFKPFTEMKTRQLI